VSPKKKLRITKRFREIIEILNNNVAMENTFLWKSVGEKRTIFPCLIEDVDPEKNLIRVKLNAETDLLKKGEMAYLKLEFREAAFKTRVITVQKNSVMLSFPEEVALEEKRTSPRFYFHPSDEKTAQLVTFKPETKDTDRLHAVLVSDVSLGGMAVFVPSKVRAFFEVGRSVKLWQLGEFRVSPPVEGELLYSIPFTIHEGMGTKDGFKVGMKFSSPLTSSVLDRFARKNLIFSIDDQQLVRDREFREQVKEKISMFHKELSKKGPFRKFLSVLEKGEGDAHYLRQHIHLLCQVMAGLGTRLGWISERSIDKLIYIAYLHDIRFANHPHLARIQGKRDYARIESTLTQEEKSAFLESPAYSAELARQDLSSFPDAIKILQQQKELPDGSGFPVGVSGVHIAPLSSLFIVSHYFVDYVIDHPNWSVEEFIKIHRGFLKGNHFQKILQALQSS
jgi:hypothetical protein